MAKKTIPLVKPKGTDGKGNIKVPGGPLVLDLGDFDDMFGPLESDSPKGGPLDEFWSGMKESFSDRVQVKDVVRNFLRSAAPDGISNLMGFADEALSASRDIKESLERTNASDLQYIAKRAQALLPKLQDYAPEGIYNDISQGLENKIDEYDYTIQSARDQTPIRRAAQERTETSEIESALDNIALSSKVNHNRSEHGAQVRHNQTRAEASVRDLLKTKRFDFMAKSMGMANDSLQQINGYNQQVNFGFQRKGLELQFRSYMGIKELIKLQEANLELNARAFNAMIRNTGMTDFEKNGNKDLQSMGGQGGGKRQGLVSKATNKTLSHFLGNYGGEAQGRISGDISQKLSMAVMAMKMGEGSGGSMWKNKYKMAGNFAGDQAGDFILNELIPMLGREARPGLTRASDKHLGGAHNKVGYALDNIPAFLQEFVNNNQNQHGMKGKLRGLIAPYVPQFGLQDRTKSSNYQTIDQPAQFNQMTQRTIVDALPGYLARILQTLRQIKTGSDDVGREIWDFTTGKFTVEGSAHDSLLAKIVPKNAIRSASTTINDALNTMDSGGNLSPKARQALSERMLRDASTNRRFDPEAYVKSGGYAKDMPADVAKELEGFFNSKFEMDGQGGMVDNAKNNKLRQEFSQAFLDIRSISRDPIKEISRIIDSGHTDGLRAIGIIITEDGIDKINYPRIWELLRSGVTDGNPFGPGGNGGHDPSRDDQSGNAGHKDFMGPKAPGDADWVKGKLSRFRTKYAPEEQAARDQMAKHLKTMRGRFGSAANHVQDMASNLPGQFQDLQKQAGEAGGYSQLLSGKYKGQMQGMADTGMAGFNQFVGKASNVVNDAVSSVVHRSEDVITDLYSQFDKNYPALRAKDFVNGSLIDVNTKQIITKLSDITGKVINMAGDTILTANEVAAGLMNPNGDIVLKVDGNSTSKVGDAIDKNQPKLNGEGGSGDPQDPNSEENLNSQDWALGPGENIVLTARGLLNGEYRDEAGKIINSIKDIAGDVFDKTGNVVLTAKEFAGGLWGRRSGTRYRPTKNFARLLRLGKAAGRFSSQSAGTIAWGATKFMAKATLGIASRLFNIFVDNQNAYTEGDPIPVLTRRSLANGEYFDDKGKVIENFVDVYSIIHDAKGEPVIPADQYKLLKNYDGTRHVLAKNKRIWGKLVMRPLRAMRNAYARQTKKYYKWLGKTSVKVGGWVGKKTLGGFAKAGGMIFNRMFEKIPDEQRATAEATAAGASVANQPVVEGLQEILQELKDQKPKEIRKGSWQDKDGKKEEGEKEKKGDAKEEKKSGFLKRGLAGIAGMLGLGGKKKKDDGEEGEEDEDGGIMDSISGAADINSLSGGKGGKIMKWGKKLIGGKASKMLGSIASSKVGQFIGKAGGQMLMRGAMMAGTAIAGLLSGPVLLIAAAVAVTAGAAYLGWNRYKNISGEFRELRLAQYGVDKPVSKGFIDSITSMDMFSLGGDKIKILKMEGLLDKFTSKDAEKPQVNISGAGGQELLDIMGIDIDDEAAVMVFARWLEKRFKPVYLQWIGGLNKIGQGTVNINDVDDKVPEELKGDFLETIRFPYNNESPYVVTENPFSPSYPLPNNMDVISKMFDELKEKYGLKKKEAEEKKAAEAGKDGKLGTPADVAKSATDGIAKDAVAATGGAAAGAGAMSAAQKLANEASQKDKTEQDKLKSPTEVANAGVLSASQAVAGMSGEIADLSAKLGRTLTALQAIRMRAYGMQFLTAAEVTAVLALEAIYAKDLTVSATSVDYGGDAGVLLSEAGRLLGKDTAIGADDRYALHGWLTNRFTPVFRAYFGAARNVQPAASLAGLESKLTASDKVTVATAMLGALDAFKRSIWDAPSLFEIMGDPKQLKALADADLASLQKDAEKEALATPTQKSSDAVAGKAAADKGGSFADQVMSGIKDTWDSAKETVSSAWNNATDAVGDTVAGAKIALGMGPEFGGGGTAKGGTVQSAGNTGAVVAGNGGQWEAIPIPTASGSIKAALPTLKAVSGMTGVPLDWLLAIVGLESGFRFGVKASTSSATGWFQFINSTWDIMYAKCVKKYGLPPDPGKTRAGRTDPRINALLGGEFTKDNWEGLKKGLGRDNITDTDVYMAHFLGLYGALKFLRADPNAFGYKVFKDAYSANMPLFFVDGKPSKPRTISEMYQMFQAKIAKFWATTGKGYKSSDGGEASTVPQAQTPGPEKTPEQIADEQLQSSLKEDAKDKDGLGKSGDGQDPLDVPGSDSIPTVASIAADTAPMPGAPATGGGSSSPSSSVNSEGADSGASSVDTQRQSQMDTAQSQNSRREAEVRRDQATASEVGDIQTKQLNTLYEIRDLMKVALEQIGNKFGGGAGGQQGSNSQSGNSMTPSGIQSRPAAQRPSSLTLK
jgi:hypothetical protein